MISIIHLPSLRNAEFIQLMRDILRIVQLNGPAALRVEDQYIKLNNLTGEMETIFLTDQGNPITAVLLALDLRRDNAVIGISKVVDGCTSHFHPNTRDAAHLLWHNLGLYGSGNNIARQNYLAQTTVVNNLVNDWETKPELVAAITTLELGTWLAELKTANTEFNNQYIARTLQLGAANPDKLRDKRQETNNMFFFMRNFIDFHYQNENGIDPWAKTTNELNALIAQYNVLLAGRANEPTEPEVPEPTPPQG